MTAENTRTAWFFCPSCSCLKVSSGENIHLDARYRYSELLVKRLLEQSAAEEVLKKIEEHEKITGWPTAGDSRA